MASLIGYFMVADELASTVFTAVILFVIAFFPVSGYSGAVAMGALDFYGCLHDFMVMF
jgi:hypothetical protein